VVGEAQTGRQAVALVKKLQPAVVVMDVAMPRLNGFEATRQILKTVPKTKVLILSAHHDDAYVQEATESGARGFLIKQTSSRAVCKAIREIQKGHTVYSDEIAKRLPERERRSPIQSKSRRASLTSREMEVLQLIAEGKPNKETATELGIRVKTVEKHREHLMVKLDIHDIAGLTRYAIAAGIIESSVPLKMV
jgi:DNA-binding NarL/FixJ family response regulator